MYQTSHLEDYIKGVYLGLNIQFPSQLNKYVIAERLNIGLYLAGGASEAIYWDGRSYIFLNRQLSSSQRWQDFGHELCHVLMHEGYQKSVFHLFRQLQEWQADNFMYHFCVPTFMLNRVRLPPDQRAAAILIAETFNVDYRFAEIRLDRYVSKFNQGGNNYGVL